MNNKIMLDKLNKIYDRIDEIEKQMKSLVLEYNQLQEDKEMAQTFYMFSENKKHRRGIK